jgi:hypothetical protein
MPEMLFSRAGLPVSAVRQGFCFSFSSQDRFVMVVPPGHAHLRSINILHHNRFLAPRQFVPRHCTSAHLSTFCNRDKFSGTYRVCTATLVMLNKICTQMAKTFSILSLQRDSFATKEPGLCQVLASSNTASLYCRAVSGNRIRITILLTI